ncbi:hypothetical protein [Listeria booriae]|uniref:Uncharacterized protein n=1 Tax=Listeria booriae TaxID=1552123 RepID=A0A7X0TLJ4_9LIST|nr:hypothetical protein [Listeria booriae]MBC1331087.1 hypothetical protein [Listeria booriae]
MNYQYVRVRVMPYPNGDVVVKEFKVGKNGVKSIWLRGQLLNIKTEKEEKPYIVFLIFEKEETE